MLGALFRTMGQFAPPPPARRAAAAAVGLRRTHLRGLIGDRVEWRSLEREVLDITAFKHPLDYGELFKARYGPTIGIRANAEPQRRARRSSTRRSTTSATSGTVGTEDEARFEMEYLLAVGTRA